MYESPIKIITGQIKTNYEDGIFRAVQNIGINVDREELLKALEYDRRQFEKGYNNAIDDFYIRFICEVKNRYPDMPIVDAFDIRNKWKQKNAQYIECEEVALEIAEQLKAGEQE